MYIVCPIPVVGGWATEDKLTILEINGKRSSPTRHTVVGYIIVGCEQFGDTITKLKLESAQPQEERNCQPTPTNSAIMKLLIDVRLLLLDVDTPTREQRSDIVHRIAQLSQ